MFYQLAQRTLELEEEGREIIRLNVGETNLPTPPCAVEAAMDYMKTSKAGYVMAGGIPELRQRIARREGCKVENVVVGQGSKHLLVDLFSFLGEMGATVMFPSPHWPAYRLISEQLGMRWVAVDTRPEQGWTFDDLPLDGVDLLVLCNPLNPAGTVYPADSMERILWKARRRQVPVIIDEAYKGLAFHDINKYDAIRVRSFSKEFNMEGWRLGYVVAPVEIAREVIRYNQVTITCVPEFIQRGGLACLEREEEILVENRRVWKDRLTVTGKLLKKSGFDFVEPEVGMYVFVTHPLIEDSCHFALTLLDNGVSVAPGGSFGNYNRYLRLTLNQPESKIKKALEIMESTLESYDPKIEKKFVY